MSQLPPRTPVASIVLLALLTGCGSGSGGGGNADADASAPQSGAASAGGDEAAPAAPSRSLGGRVADGYIRGATVCVDLDGDEACGPDEPSTVTGAGGSWSLELTAETEGMPVIADIPATAIDEDTDEAIGQALVFTAPASRPEFLSPITTLVQQELHANPALDVAAAESVVKASLGLEGEENVSLFDDYVEMGRRDDGAPGQAERFRYLHETARVVASLMKDIEGQVSEAAAAQGHDVGARGDTARAIREIVREEVRELLPSIAREVASRLEENEAAVAVGVDGTAGAGADGRLDPDMLAELLRPVDAAERVDERIEAIREREAPQPADLATRLQEGIYWVEADCKSAERDPGVDPVDAQAGADSPLTGDDRDDDGTREASDGFDEESATSPKYGEEDSAGYVVPASDRCEAFYGLARLDETGLLRTTEFAYRAESGLWIERDGEDEAERYRAGLVLLDGEWVEHERRAPEGEIRFTDEGVAIISGPFGETELYGSTWSLAGTPIAAHLRGVHADGVRHALADDAARFPDPSTAIRLKVIDAVPTHVLRRYPDADPTDGFDCSEFGYDCNVVHALRGGERVAQTSLEAMRASIGSGGLDVLAAGGESHDGSVVVLRLEADVTADGALPEAGEAIWMRRGHDDRRDGDQDPVGEESYPESDATEAPLRGRWRSVTVDGVEMLEIAQPAALRFDDDDDDHGAAILFAEREGFVRRGARLPARRVDTVMTYDRNAFDALRTALETRLAGSADR